FELGSRSREQFLSRLDVPVHRATDIEEEKYFHCIVPLRTHQNVEVAFMCCPLDSAVEIKFLGCAPTRVFAQATQRKFNIAGAKLDFVIEILELSFVPYLDRAKIAIDVLTDANAFRIVAIGAVRRCAGSSDPLRAALVATLLLGQPFAQR